MDPNTCEITEVGATWCEKLKIVYPINGSDDKLYEIDRTTDTATYLADLIDENGDTFNFGSVGIELHPLNGEIYACSGAAKELLHIDPATGTVTKIGTGMGHEKTGLRQPRRSMEKRHQ